MEAGPRTCQAGSRKAPSVDMVTEGARDAGAGAVSVPYPTR
jgi:hypothetical protein